jgi:Lrp/AsnC family leucine-responsive transcriptional regulator
MKLDSIDVRILKAVQEDSRISSQELGEKSALSPSAAQRRLNALRDAGVITKEVALVSPEKVGRPLLLIAEVTLVNDSPGAVREFIDMLKATDAVAQCYYVTGAADYVVHYLARTMSEYDEFTQAAFFNNKFVSTFTTKVVMRVIKSGPAIAVE